MRRMRIPCAGRWNRFGLSARAPQAASGAAGESPDGRGCLGNTFIGAAKLAAASDEPLSVLRERVTSKGGTTAAALSVMTERDLPAVIAAALEAARSRSAEMGEEFGQAR